ncbi:hypothetical protein MASR2M117_16570 [Paludibacter sp.]
MNIIIRYFIANKFICSIALYFIIAIILKITISIDILIPCLWKSLFHFKCPGCGLTHAFIEIIQFRFVDAFTTNPLIFIVLPIGVVCIYKDFIKFKKISLSK